MRGPRLRRLGVAAAVAIAGRVGIVAGGAPGIRRGVRVTRLLPRGRQPFIDAYQGRNCGFSVCSSARIV